MRTLRLPSLVLISLLASPAPSYADDAEQERVARQMIQMLEAYAVYKMGEFDQAFSRYQTLAEAGNAQGMLNLGNMYAAGLGTPADLPQAFTWYQRAAQAGDAIGQYEVAHALDNGLGVAMDKAAARQWYLRAAEADNSEAQWQLGQQLYQDGQTSEALRWIRSAAQMGNHPTAQQFLQRLQGSGATRALTQQEQTAIAQVFAHTRTAAHNRDAEAMVAALTEDAQIHIRLAPGSSWQTLTRTELQALWLQTFSQAQSYHYQRGAAELLANADDILAFSLIQEQLGSATQTQALELHEQATLQVTGGVARIHNLRLDIRPLND